MHWAVWAAPLAVIMLIWTCNVPYRERPNNKAFGCLLELGVLGLLVASFVISGWKIGLVAVACCLVLSQILSRLAIRSAVQQLPSQDLAEYERERFSDEGARFGSEEWFEQHEQEKAEQARHMEASVASALRDRAVAKVLAQTGADANDLAALYRRFEVWRLPPVDRAKVLKNGTLVRFFIENSEPATNPDGTYCRNLSLNAAMRLSVWTQRSPGGAEPHRG